jgi:hypothetical protein
VQLAIFSDSSTCLEMARPGGEGIRDGANGVRGNGTLRKDVSSARDGMRKVSRTTRLTESLIVT